MPFLIDNPVIVAAIITGAFATINTLLIIISTYKKNLYTTTY